ncbi:response regulator transcription factor [Aliarcobacter cryaerophilus]|uniref:Response regulator transcription factor n=2 Tax=unclassified Arcobacter TaxID=2593671 RepID=A0AA96D6M4_9BACT|nr:response regulator transcription factor [Arcobacter sp. AZ-2023]WPD10441.1 response regulator transcription factor [Arcobacter sp. DSM 115954]WNL15270.1 response regulator transcription factor [Arcobacter sp. AZ-2023]WNL18847.1 response regulator transcription factor [Arcobacter sp. AZ-2023]WNL20985.1 response regulator transcription factor [Arcobacter sp. AZ-2023]
MKILLLEDDVILNEIIEEFLLSLNYDVITAFDGNIAEELIYEESFDLLLFDVNIPNITGFELLKNIRQNNINIPIIFITSRHTADDVKIGFNSGCDDYIKKPFELSELQLRIENVKRLRQIDNHGQIKIDNDTFYNYEKKVIIRNNEEFNLSKIESKILEYFLKNKNKAISIDEISVNNWLYDEMPESTTIRTYIKNLRKKLNDETITTLKGIGYRFNIR